MNSKIRVAFFPPSDASWMGGVNYYKNLFFAIKNHLSDKVEVIIILPKKSDKEIISYYLDLVDDVYYVDFLDKNKFSGFLCKLEAVFFKTNYLVESFLKKNRIDVVSHSNFTRLRKVKSIAWIPDFQHLHLPEMFTKKEIRSRNRKFTRLIDEADSVLVSSFDALNDFNFFSSSNIDKAKVLQFVSQPESDYLLLSDNDKFEVQLKYGLPENYFYLPNQFWKHKNHMVAFECIKILREKSVPVCLVCTGNLTDYRSPEYILSLKDYIVSNGLSDHIKMLGLVPYKDVFSLVRFSKAVINPSLFEGWSSTVEECKSVDKMMVVSDINVHKEQVPNAIFFDKNSPESLAKVLEFLTVSERKNIDISTVESRTREYAMNYLKVIKTVL